MKHKDNQRIPDPSPPQWDCQRCGRRMQKWKHAPDWVPPKGKSWFVFWYECLNKECRTRQVMPKAGFVKAGGIPAPQHAELDQLQDEELQRMAHFRTI